MVSVASFSVRTLTKVWSYDAFYTQTGWHTLTWVRRAALPSQADSWPLRIRRKNRFPSSHASTEQRRASGHEFRSCERPAEDKCSTGRLLHSCWTKVATPLATEEHEESHRYLVTFDIHPTRTLNPITPVLLCTRRRTSCLLPSVLL